MQNYEEHIPKSKPYLIKHKGDKKSVFAVCPSCDNPIQLIGLFKLIENPKNPYGKHVPHDIDKLATYNQDAYIYCPYSNPHRKFRKDRRRGEDKLANELIALLHSQFDRVVNLLQKDIDVRLSPNLLKKLLSDYFAMEFCLYYGATLNNMPWIFGYACSHKSLFGQYIRKGSGLYNAILEHCPDAVFVDDFTLCADRLTMSTNTLNTYSMNQQWILTLRHSSI
jgi:hypothetical protein